MIRKAGVREARQNLSVLLDEVKRGRAVDITERGAVVARLVPPEPARAQPFPGRSAFRNRMSTLRRTLSAAVLAEREDRD